MKEADEAMTRAGTAPVETGRHECGLRERKKARTRDALIDSALRLFGDQGFTATTTEQIAASVEVSQRTFFRYFSSKEEVVTAAQDALDDEFRSRLADQPAALHPLHALRNAALGAWSTLDDGALQAQLLLFRLYEEHPPLLACHFRRSAEREKAVVEAIAHRAGVDPEADCRPRLVAAAFSAAVTTAVFSRQHGNCDDGEKIAAVIARHLDALGPALTEPWHLRAGEAPLQAGGTPPAS